MTAASDFDGASLRSGIRTLYSAPDEQTAGIRAALLNSVVRLTPQTMAANMGSSSMVVWAFRVDVPAGMWMWWFSLLVVSGLGLLSWWRGRLKSKTMASPRALHRATVHAAVLSGLWAVLPLMWFAHVSPAQQLLVATLVTGMMGAGAFVLSPVPLASLAYALIYTLGALGALLRAGDPTFVGVAVLLVFYSMMVVVGSLFAWRKATALLLSQAEAVRQERMLTVLLEDFEAHADEALWQTGGDGRLTHVSPRLADLVGLDSHTIGALTVKALLEARKIQGTGALGEALETGRPFREVRLTIPDRNNPRHLSINGKPLFDERGQACGWRGVLADVTHKVAAEQKLVQLAHTDSLTGLANRFTLHDALREGLAGGRSGALLTIDLDHFKSVNDTHGHSAGDELLKAVALRLGNCVRPGDLVARLGGDEFAILMRQAVTRDDAAALARRLIEALSRPIEVQGRRLRVGASVGVVLCDGTGLGVDELLVQSDAALYEAKAAGRGGFSFYSAELGERGRHRMDIEEGLRRAIDQGQLALHWQPKVDIGAWQIVGAEGLMRWTHPVLGEVSPGEFIVIAEQCGLIDELGHWALREACRTAAGPLAGMCLSVNVSPVQLRNGQFVNQVRDALREFHTEPFCLELEITESVFLDDVAGALEQLHALRGLGVRIALDDFGTGYSSLAYLRQFPFDTLKVDRTFVSEVLSRADSRAIVQMIAQLAATLGMRTVSEGVETAQQLAAVGQAGCHEVQGFLVSRALPLDDFVRFCRGWSGHPPLTATLH